jgi:hypothetical protein
MYIYQALSVLTVEGVIVKLKGAQMLARWEGSEERPPPCESNPLSKETQYMGKRDLIWGLSPYQET